MQTPDLALGARKAQHFRYVATPVNAPGRSRYAPPGSIVFGDGENGRVPSPGSLVLASYSWTLAEAGNFASAFIWARSDDRDPDRREEVKRYPAVRFRNPLPAAGGCDAEPLSTALLRLAEEFAAPEKLVELAASNGGVSLDGVDLSRAQTPAMAVNLVDFECLARRVPGTVVARARAWPEVDPRFPNHVAPGAVTLVNAVGRRGWCLDRVCRRGSRAYAR